MPPLDGATTVTVAWPFPVTTVGVPGEAGAESVGVTALDAVELVEVPPPLDAVEVKVYEVPLVNPVTTQDPEAPVTVQVAPPGEAVTKYEVGLPPLDGDETVTVACPSPATAVAWPGVPGAGGSGVVLAEAGEEFEVPPSLDAVEVNVYEVPLVNPVTTQDPEAPVTVQVAPPGEAVTKYEVGLPPLDGDETVTVACPSPATAVAWPGVPGGVGGET